jgi:hypothetical protein
MSEIRAIGFVARALDPGNIGTNALREEGDDVSNAAVVGACAARTAESKGDGIGGVPQLEPRATGPVEGKGGVKGDGALRKRMRTDN